LVIKWMRTKLSWLTRDFIYCILWIGNLACQQPVHHSHGSNYNQTKPSYVDFISTHTSPTSTRIYKFQHVVVVVVFMKV
jgi:hypothetical protein